jgi:AraC family transcriptional regulator of arabinose operon
MEHNPLSSSSGYKRFFAAGTNGSPELLIRGVGIRELMPPCMVQRPRGTGDFLLILMHDAAAMGTAPGPEISMQPDRMMIWSPGAGQYYGNPERRFCHTWIHCAGSRVESILTESALPRDIPFAMPDPSHFQQCLLNVHGELVSYAAPDFRIIGNLLENCIRHLARSLAASTKSARIPEGLLAVRQFISNAPARDVHLEELAEMAGMSVPHFSSSFKKIYGLPPMECLKQHRMHHAAHLLANHNLAISEIASLVGYDDLFHFSKMFKKQFGVSPRHMRNRSMFGRDQRGSSR